MKWTLTLAIMMASGLCFAGERVFKQGNGRLVNQPFALVEPLLSGLKDQEMIELEREAIVTWSDGSGFTRPVPPGRYEKRIYHPVRLLPKLPMRRHLSDHQHARAYDCTLKIITGSDLQIMQIGTRGRDCGFDLAAHVLSP